MQNIEKLSLGWKDFRDNISSTFGELRAAEDFADVTLVSQDGEQMESHKIVLASSSSFFKNLLLKAKHNHPLIVLKGVNSENLSAILDFLYFGETRILQENLETFLALAEDLQLKGLAGSVERSEMNENTQTRPKQKKRRPAPPQTDPIMPKEQPIEDEKPALLEQSGFMQSVPVDLGELDKQIQSMTSTTFRTDQRNGKTYTNYACKVCGKEGLRKDVGRHIEAIHITGVSHNCDICGKTATSRDAVRQHKRIHS